MQKAISQIKNLSDNPYLFCDENGKKREKSSFFSNSTGPSSQNTGPTKPMFCTVIALKNTYHSSPI